MESSPFLYRKENIYILSDCLEGRAYCCALRCTGFDVLSLSLNKERTKENQLKGLMPLRNPQVFLLSLTAAHGGKI